MTAPQAVAPEPSAAMLGRFLEVAEFALDNEPERVDALVELCDRLEDAWLAACERDPAA